MKIGKMRQIPQVDRKFHFFRSIIQSKLCEAALHWNLHNPNLKSWLKKFQIKKFSKKKISIFLKNNFNFLKIL